MSLVLEKSAFPKEAGRDGTGKWSLRIWFVTVPIAVPYYKNVLFNMGFHLVLLCVLESLPHELLCILFEVNHFKIYILSYFYFKNFT